MDDIMPSVTDQAASLLDQKLQGMSHAPIIVIDMSGKFPWKWLPGNDWTTLGWFTNKVTPGNLFSSLTIIDNHQ